MYGMLEVSIGLNAALRGPRDLKPSQLEPKCWAPKCALPIKGSLIMLILEQHRNLLLSPGPSLHGALKVHKQIQHQHRRRRTRES